MQSCVVLTIIIITITTALQQRPALFRYPPTSWHLYTTPTCFDIWVAHYFGVFEQLNLPVWCWWCWLWLSIDERQRVDGCRGAVWPFWVVLGSAPSPRCRPVQTINLRQELLYRWMERPFSKSSGSASGEICKFGSNTSPIPKQEDWKRQKKAKVGRENPIESYTWLLDKKLSAAKNGQVKMKRIKAFDREAHKSFRIWIGQEIVRYSGPPNEMMMIYCPESKSDYPERHKLSTGGEPPQLANSCNTRGWRIYGFCYFRNFEFSSTGSVIQKTLLCAPPPLQ